MDTIAQGSPPAVRSDRRRTNERQKLLEDIAAVRWRLWNGQTDRAIDLIGRLFLELKAEERGSSAIVPPRGSLLNLHTYIEQNRRSIT
jgi:hypothetical protein